MRITRRQLRIIIESVLNEGSEDGFRIPGYEGLEGFRIPGYEGLEGFRIPGYEEEQKTNSNFLSKPRLKTDPNQENIEQILNELKDLLGVRDSIIEEINRIKGLDESFTTRELVDFIFGTDKLRDYSPKTEEEGRSLLDNIFPSQYKHDSEYSNYKSAYTPKRSPDISLLYRKLKKVNDRIRDRARVLKNLDPSHPMLKKLSKIFYPEEF